MTSNMFMTIMEKLGYDDISDSFIKMPNISRINLTTNNSIYREEKEIIAYYYFDSERGLLIKAVRREDGSTLGISGIIDVNEIVSIETRNLLSASMFSGNSY